MAYSYDIFAVRTKRVKEARDEAKKEINDYKSKKDQEFKKFEAEVGAPFTLTPYTDYRLLTIGGG